MKTKYLFIAAIGVVTLASCADDVFVGDNSPNAVEQEATNTEGMINFGLEFPNRTRGDIYGLSAAEILGKNFYVVGTKGTEGTDNPSPNIVFNNYLVRYTENTAGTTVSNTANWEYVGVAADANHVKLSPAAVTAQTIKYWDFSAAQYDFHAFSTGNYKAVNTNSGNDDEIGVTASLYGTGLASSAVAYTFDLPNIGALQNTYITDITEVLPANYKKEVTLQFKNLGSKVRVALYETVPGYSVQAASVYFYEADGIVNASTDFGALTKSTNATLISENANSFATSGKVQVRFPNVGTDHENDNYDKASATVTDPGGGDTKKTFGTLDNKANKEGSETEGALYLGRTLPTATFAGLPNDKYYQTVFPVSTSYPLTLRIDYTLVSTDGQGETITVKGAKAVVPATYTKWQPNYAYTYVFKISDNTNGWTGTGAQPAGLFPITFDAVVAEATDSQGDQTTVTTVATPSITTYQQGHNTKKDGTFNATSIADEYSKSGEKLYVQVMDNNLSPAVLVGTGSSTLKKLNDQTPETTPTDRALLYLVTGANITEAKVMDALEKRTTALTDDDVIGRNGIELELDNTNIDATVTSIENGVDDNAISVNAGEAAEINISALSAGIYAFVYDYSDDVTPKTTVTEYQPVTVTAGTAIDETSKTYYYIGTNDLDALTPSDAEANVDDAYLYFSKTLTKNDDGVNPVTYTYTYSYISVSDKEKVPAGVVKIEKSTVFGKTISGNSTATAANTFYFDIYIENNGKYAVKVIKVV